MNTHVDQTKENKSQAVSASSSQMQSGGESTFQFVDNRPEAIAQRKLQEMANNSPQVSQLRALQEMANNSPQVNQAAQLQAMADNHSAQQQQLIQKKENNTGLPDNLKTGMENLSGLSMDDVKVHRNSDKPAQLQAHAYAQGTDIHLGPGQEKHLPHEAWHVVQQKQGRVKPTMQLKGLVNINDNAGLEKEADLMGEKALQLKPKKNTNKVIDNSFAQKNRTKVFKPDSIIQGYFTNKGIKLDTKSAESVHGWAHINLPLGDLRTNFFKIYNDKDNSTSIEDWFHENNIELNDDVFKHLSHFVMGELELKKSELIFEMENMYQDTYQSINDIPGADKLMKDIASVDISKPTAFAFLQGYQFQVNMLIDYANKSKYVESDSMDELKPKVKAVETEYQDHNGVSRWADMEVNNSDDESSSYIEIKAMATNYEPNQQTKDKFKRQALAYSKCGKNVTYLFKNNPPDWVKEILTLYKLEFEIDN